jgi:hypothetical protein
MLRTRRALGRQEHKWRVPTGLALNRDRNSPGKKAFGLEMAA